MTRTRNISDLLDSNGDVKSGSLDNVPAVDLTNLSATNLTSGTIPAARFPATIDGRDLSTDGTKLDGIEASADVTDATNVAAAGALMTTGGSVTGDVSFGGNVGIGTASPSELLDVYSGSTNARIQVQTNNSSSVPAIEFRNTAAGSQIGMPANVSAMTFTTSDNERMRVDSSGKVGIGTVSPAHNLDVTQTGSTSARIGATGSSGDNDGTVIINNGGSGDAMLRFDYEGNTDRARIGVSSSGQQLEFYTAGNNERMRIDASGNVGVGTSSPSSYDSRGNNLVVGDSGDAGITIFSGSTSDGRLVFAASGDTGLSNGVIGYDQNSDAMTFEVGGSEAMRIIPAPSDKGTLCIGRTTNIGGARLVVDADGDNENPIGIVQTHAGSSLEHLLLFYRGNDSDGYSETGSIRNTNNSTVYNTSSDYRLKTAVNYDWDATTRLKQLKPARFEWISDGDSAVPVDGFIAHEVSSIVPEAISGTKDAMTDAVLYVDSDEIPDGKKVGDVKTAPQIKPQGIDQSKLVPLLTKALIESVAKIEALEARITALEAG